MRLINHHPTNEHHHNHHHDDHTHEHEHTHNHDYRNQDKKVLKLALIITFITMVLEFVYGFLGNSLALISDAIHMFTHSFALIISLFAIIISSKSAPASKSFGYYRVEILAAFVNGLTIFLTIFWILYEAIERFITPQEIDVESTLIVAIIGLIVNAITGYILLKGDHSNINLKSAFIHMIGDALSSVAIIIGLVVVYYTGWTLIDPLIALLIAFVIGKWAYSLLSESIHTLVEGSPVDIDAVSVHMNEFEFVMSVSDLHIVKITDNMVILTAHIGVEKNLCDNYQEMINQINSMLKHDFNITHSTIQIEWV